ncbi:hypothetical protein [Mycolicibacterium palauense]|uniref:hypothetical protein n=1 Tax=Mycolicibacterium palauense TaxID=2034511 RepID=UPI000BFEC8A1|nr:hypothetical protein [Mycolicibacterium palauense]
MAVYEVLTVFVIVVVGTFTTVAIYLGLLGWMGAFHIVRCRTCHHLTMATANRPQSSCPHCRHPMLTHPLYAVNHPDNHVRVLSDRPKY